ncbi:unnamed protein product [Schistosoma margrebowiei]|uniref:Uncharacterized protein n=1 Tax=Schistosoma margrebowiei TaxID=48269 RepID=A0A3P8I9K1_9TREM|nr:unnamed protein product [Schistosoma margrebowiei]
MLHHDRQARPPRQGSNNGRVLEILLSFEAFSLP